MPTNLPRRARRAPSVHALALVVLGVALITLVIGLDATNSGVGVPTGDLRAAFDTPQP